MLEKEIAELEKLGKPIVYCEVYDIEKQPIQHFFPNGYFEIRFLGKKTWQLVTSFEIEEKENTLITDDFIFVKE